MDPSDERELEKLRRDKRKAEKKDNLKEVAQICNCIGEILSKYGRWEDAIVEHETELALSEALDDKIGCAVACRKIGECYCGLEQYDKALKLQQRHLVLAKACSDMLEEQRALATIGRTYLFQSDSERDKKLAASASKQAGSAFMKSLELCEQLKSKVSNIEFIEMKTRLILNLGLVYDGRGDVRQCAELMKKAITLAEKHKLYSDLYRCQYSLASMYQRSSNLSQALRQLDEAQKCAQKLKDKHLESDALTLKSQIYIELGDMGNGKHCMKKAHKFGSSLQCEAERIRKYFRSAVKMEEALTDLDMLTDDLDKQIKFEEKVADAAVDLGLYKLAIKYYLKMLNSATSLGAPKQELIPIYVSLAQTYADDKQFEKALEFYQKELDCRENEPEQEYKTWMSIAEILESDGRTYSVISDAYLKAFECSRRGKLRKCQVQVLKLLIAAQKRFSQNSHLQQTESKFQKLKEKYGIGSEDEMSEEESQAYEESEEQNLSLSDLTESDNSEEENVNTGPDVIVGRSRGRQLRAKRNEKGETPLHRACIEGNLKKVEKLIEQGHSVNPRDYCGWIPLHEAANHDHYNIVEFLLANGAAVNDRGGQHCGGVTPLIDAASCGNLEIVELLLSRGANPLAKDDEDQTALEGLISWRERASETLTQDILMKCENVERLLSNRMPGKTDNFNKRRSDEMLYHCQSPRLTPSSHLTQSDIGEMPNLKGPRHTRARNEDKGSRRRRVSSSDSDAEPIRTQNRRQSPVINTYSSDSEDEIDVHANPGLEDIVSQNSSATDIYRSAIDRIGSASRLTTNHQPAASEDNRAETDRQALIFEEECVSDDWLVEDIRPSKRRKVDMNGLFSTSSTRQPGEKRSSKNAPSREGRIDAVNNDELLCDNENCDNEIVTGIDDNDVVVTGQTIPELTCMNSGSLSGYSERNSKTNCRKKQSRMTNFITNENNQSERSSVLSNHNLNQTRKQDDMNRLSTNSVLSQHNVQFNNVAVMRIKVKVKDKLLLIPVTNSDNSKPISWLAKETSQRYYSLCGLRPLLTLRTKDGAFLSPDDPITLVLTSNEEIDGTVESWDLPPLTERYTAACKTLKSTPYRNIRTLLCSCDQSGKLELGNLSLRSCHIRPVLRSLQCQNRLTQLNITGNRLGDEGMESLCKALETLPNLSMLNLSSNEITAVGLKCFSNHMSTTDPKPLQCLSSLDLSWNSLGDGSTLYLTGIIGHLTSLVDLSIAACGLTAQFFQQHRLQLADCFHNCQIACLNVSYNKFSELGLELLLRSLNHRKIVDLDLAATLTSLATPYTLHYLQNYLKQDCCNLQKLSLAECHLTAENSDLITRLPETTPELKNLNLSRNSKLDNSVMQGILEVALSSESRLDILCMDGCAISSPLTSDFLDSVSDKLASTTPLRFLSFTCRHVDKVDTESINQIWMERWEHTGRSDIQGNTIRLSVVENM